MINTCPLAVWFTFWTGGQLTGANGSIRDTFALSGRRFVLWFFFFYHFDPAENVSTMTSSSEQVHERTRQQNVQKDSSTSPKSRAPEKLTETQGSHTFWAMYFHNCSMTFKIWVICITFTGLTITFPGIFMFSRTVGTLWISQQAISEWGILENYIR